MKILIADDQMQRYAPLIEELRTIGVNREDIDLAASKTQAADFLENKHYDLFILDILLPQYPEDIATSKEYSIDLLNEIRNTNNYNRPKHIVGITSDKSVALEAGRFFLDSTWTIVEYSEMQDEWIGQLKNCAAYIKNQISESKDQKKIYGVDVAIVCALQSETRAVLGLEWNWGVSRPIDDVLFVRDGWFLHEGKKVSVVAATAPRMGMVSSAILASRIIEKIRPKIITMCGICAGVKEKVSIGDVLFADVSWDFQSGKKVVDKDIAKLSVAPHQISADQIIRSHIAELIQDTELMCDIHKNFGLPPYPIPKIFVGPVASGSVVLADGQTIKEIRSQHRELIGVEMEVYGLYAAATSSSNPRPKVFALKSVCDFADPEKDDEAQKYAAYTSARVLQALMQRYASRLLD